MTTDTLQQLIIKTFNHFQSQDGWVNLAEFGGKIRGIDPTFSPQSYGHDRLSSLLESQDQILELRRDTSGGMQIVFGRLRNLQALPTVPEGSHVEFAPSAAPLPLLAPAKRVSQVPGIELTNWAYLGFYSNVLNRLAFIALYEDWEFRQSHSNPDKPHPILHSYLRYTFYRLKIEGKILIQHVAGKSFAAFNTGLVDKRYEPIYALLRPNQAGRAPAWQLSSFCIAAEDLDGKELVRYFNPLPQPAHYFDTFNDVLYDVRAPDPQLDWEHIILENIDRIPHELIAEKCPPGFELQEAGALSYESRERYFTVLADAIKNHSPTYRVIKNRMQDALHLSLKRVRWNFKTAIPTYFPKRNRISLLLPLALISDERVDRALVVERTPSGNYLGHTILPLDWAYSNARLVCRPDSDWLTVKEIDSESTLEEEAFED